MRERQIDIRSENKRVSWQADYANTTRKNFEKMAEWKVDSVVLIHAEGFYLLSESAENLHYAAI